MLNRHIGIELDVFFEQNINLIHHSIKKYKPALLKNGIDYEDAYQVGSMAMVRAYKNFDPTRFKNVLHFSTFAVPTIRGSVLRLMREHSPGVHYPRSIREFGLLLLKEDLLDYAPDVILEKLIPFQAKLEMYAITPSLDSIDHALMYLRHRQPMSLSTPILGDGSDSKDLFVSDIVPSYDDFTTVFVEDFLSRLSDRERMIMELRMKDVSQLEIGNQFGISQVQISRIIKRIGERLIQFNTARAGLDKKVVPLAPTQPKIKEITPVTKVESMTPEEETMHLLTTTRLTYLEISNKTGVHIKKVERLGLKHRPAELRKKNNKPGRYAETTGDRKKAAELIYQGLGYEEVSKLTNVPIGSLSKVREYADKQRELGLPVTGEALPIEIVKEMNAQKRLERQKKKEQKERNKKAPKPQKKSSKQIAFQATTVDEPTNPLPVRDKKPTPTPKEEPVVSIALAPVVPTEKVEPVRTTPTSVDYEFEAGHVPAEHFLIQLEALKQIVSTNSNVKVSYTIGINIKGE